MKFTQSFISALTLATVTFASHDNEMDKRSLIAARAGAAVAAAGQSAATANNADPQNSLTLSTSQVQAGLTLDGQQKPEANQVASATSGNNFINFCLTRSDLPLTNGAQVKTGSCNPTVMGVIAAQTKMPSCKFANPANGATVKAFTDFIIQMKINNLVTGNFVNAAANYFAAPQNTDASGQVIGHSHVVIEAIDSLGTTTVSDPTTFAFFKGLNTAAVNGVLSATVTGGLPPGTYKMSSINTAANHQPVLVAVAQHGSLDDVVYFTVTTAGTGAAVNGQAGNGAAAGAGTGAVTPSSSSSSAAAVVATSAATTSSAAVVATGGAKGIIKHGGQGGARRGGFAGGRGKGKAGAAASSNASSSAVSASTDTASAATAPASTSTAAGNVSLAAIGGKAIVKRCPLPAST